MILKFAMDRLPDGLRAPTRRDRVFRLNSRFGQRPVTL